MILAIDPGPVQSAYVLWDGHVVVEHGKLANDKMLEVLIERTYATVLVIEMIASYGMPVGAEVFETCVWIGRFEQAWGGVTARLKRQDVKLHLCGSPRAKDANIRQALIDRLGPPGTKREPGATHGVKADVWAALAVAVTFGDMRAGLQEQRGTTKNATPSSS